MTVMGDVSLDEASWSQLASGHGNVAVLQIHCLYIQYKNFFFFFFCPLRALAFKSDCRNYKVNHGCQSEEVLFLIFADCVLYVKLTFQNSLSTVYIL